MSSGNVLMSKLNRVWSLRFKARGQYQDSVDDKTNVIMGSDFYLSFNLIFQMTFMDSNTVCFENEAKGLLIPFWHTSQE